jgi:hypothetical protein
VRKRVLSEPRLPKSCVSRSKSTITEGFSCPSTSTARFQAPDVDDERNWLMKDLRRYSYASVELNVRLWLPFMATI